MRASRRRPGRYERSSQWATPRESGRASTREPRPYKIKCICRHSLFTRREFSSYNPRVRLKTLVWALPCSLADTKGIYNCSSFLHLLECFTSVGSRTGLRRTITVYVIRFPHSDIPGSQVATHLPETFRRYAASFIAFSSLGIHHSPLMPTIPMLTFIYRD